jgi:hypothetical protein
MGILAAATFAPSISGSVGCSSKQKGKEPDTVAAKASERSDLTAETASDSVLKPNIPVKVRTAPIKKISGDTSEEIIASLYTEDRDPLFSKYLSALERSAQNPRAFEKVLRHIRDLSHVLDGHCLAYAESKNVQALAGEPSAYRLLLIKLMPLVHFFPKDLAFEGRDALRGRDPSTELLEALQGSLEANLCLARHIIPEGEASIDDRALTFVPHYLIFSDVGFKIEAASLIGRVRGGYFEELSTYLDCLPRMPANLARPVLGLFDALFFLRGEERGDIGILASNYIKDAKKLHHISPALGEAYLTCLTSLNVSSLEELNAQAELLRSYVEGILRNGEPNAALGLQSIASLRGRLHLDEATIRNMVLLHRYTGFLRVERLQDTLLDRPDLPGSGSGGALKAYLNELAAFIRDPRFRSHSKIAAVVFAGTQDVLSTGSLLSHIESHGYVPLPFEALTDLEMARACEAVKEIAGRPADLVLVIGDGCASAHEPSSESGPVIEIAGNPMGVTNDPQWFEPVNKAGLEGYLSKVSEQDRNQEIRGLLPWTKERLASSTTTIGRATLDTSDSAIFDRLANGTCSTTQFLFVGSNTAHGDDNPARRIHLATGCDVFGSGDSMTGVDIQFDNDYRVSHVQFKLRDSSAAPQMGGAPREPAPVESIWYRAQK